MHCVHPNAGDTVSDTLAPPAAETTPATSVTQPIGDREFGEAGIDLSAAGVFPRGDVTQTTCLSLGKSFAVSRSSGNFGLAQMEDLVRPAPLSISNCGTVIINKTTVPTGGTGFPFTSTVSTDPTDSTNASFSLKDAGTKTISNVLPGSYNVTETVASIGDKRWRDLLDRHDDIVLREVERHGGRRVKTTGDGVLATFNGPAQGIRTALAIRDALASIGVPVRAGLHTGEVEIRGDDVAGIAVHIGKRVSDKAGAGEVLVSRTLPDLVAGSGLEFDDRGEYELTGVPGHWQLFAVRS